MAKPNYYQNLKELFTRWVETEEGQTHPYRSLLKYTPDIFLVLCKLMVNPMVPVSEKAKLATVVAYFAAPVDLIPEESEGAAGFVDDIVLAAYVMNSVAEKASLSTLESHWVRAEIGIMELVNAILEKADDMVGTEIWEALKNRVGGA